MLDKSKIEVYCYYTEEDCIVLRTVNKTCQFVELRFNKKHRPKFKRRNHYRLFLEAWKSFSISGASFDTRDCFNCRLRFKCLFDSFAWKKDYL